VSSLSQRDDRSDGHLQKAALEERGAADLLCRDVSRTPDNF